MLYNKLSRIAFALSFALGSSSIYASSPVTESIPKEFRDLWGEEDELIEVRLYGQSLGIHRIKTTPTTIRFESPDNVLSKIDVSKNKDKLKELMQDSFPRNSNLSCQGGAGDQVSRCNYIKTNTVAVVVDDAENILNLFIGEQFLTSNNSTSGYHKVSRNTEKALIHSQVINFSDSAYYKQFYVSGAGSLGVTENSYAVLDWGASYSHSKYDSYNAKSVNSLYFRHDMDSRYYYQIGRMNRSDLSSRLGGSFNFNLLPVPDIDGGRIGTTQSYMKSIGKSVSSPVQVMLTRFSRVEAYRNEQLLGVWYLDSGINELDTDRLPDGNYDLKLKIFEQDQLAREETISFNKGRASIDDMQWDVFIQAGDVINDKNSYIEKQNNHKSAVNAGTRLPVTRNLSVQQGMSVIDNKDYYESGFRWNSGLLDGSLNGNVSFLVGDGARGNYQNITYTDGFSLSFYHNDKRVDNCGKSYNVGWSGCYESYSASLSVPVSGWTSTLAYSDTYNESVNRYDAVSEYDYYNYYKYKGRTKRWQFTASTTLRWMDYNIIPSIGVYNSEQSHWTDKGGYASLTLTRVNGDKSLTAGYAYNYSQNNNASNEAFVEGRLASNTHGDYRELSARISGNKYHTEGGVTGRSNNRFGDLNGTFSINKNRNIHDSSHSLTAGYSSSFALTTDGLYWGGNASGLKSLSGGVVRVKSNQNEKNLLNVGGSLYGGYTLGSNDNAFIPVPPLEPTRLTIEENTIGNKNVNIYAPSESRLFILPGNIYPVDVEASVSITWVGRGIDRNGNPLSDAHILNSQGITLDKDGAFSFENTVADNENKLFMLKDKTIYSCPLNKSDVRSGIIFVGEIVCESISREYLPGELVKNSRVQKILASR